MKDKESKAAAVIIGAVFISAITTIITGLIIILL